MDYSDNKLLSYAQEPRAGTRPLPPSSSVAAHAAGHVVPQFMYWPNQLPPAVQTLCLSYSQVLVVSLIFPTREDGLGTRLGMGVRTQ